MDIVRFQGDEAERWDAFCHGCYGATFLHTRRFLSYHGDRFADRSLVVQRDGAWLGVLPLALDPTDAHRVISHPGITYGGLLHQGALRGEAMVTALSALCATLREHGMRRLLYRPVPGIYARAPAEDDRYALFRLGARLVRSDLSSCIDLSHRLPVSERRRRGLKKARESGPALASGAQWLPGLWPVVQENLARAHGVQPVHTLAEIEALAARFPEQVRCLVATLEQRVVAGLVLFMTPRVVHAQYIASSEQGQGCHALDLLFDRAIEDARHMNARYFDFGISTVEQGRVVNEGLHRFKTEFGAGGVVHEHHEVTL